MNKLIALALATGLAVALQPGAQAQVNSGTGSSPKTLDTRIGELKYEAGYPDGKTVEKIYDEIDFQRACQAYLWGFPLVSAASVRRGLFQDIGATYNDFEMYAKYLDATGLWLTGNTTTIYSAAIIDLAKDGPVVVEIPAGPAAGMIGDYWFITTGVGALGPDKGNGGKFLLVPPGYKGDLPTEGYIVTPSRMNDTTFFIRGMVVNGDEAGAVALLKRAHIYPYSQRDNPKPNRFFDVSEKPINTLEPEGLAFWKLLSEVINNNPVQEHDRFYMAMLKPLGIEKGKPFTPDDRQKKILEEGARLGKAMAQITSFSPRLANVFYYPGRNWTNTMNFNTKQASQQESEYYSELDERLNYFYLGTWPNEAMNLPFPSNGQRYLESFKDKDGNWLDGGKTYRLRVPADVPAKQFWSITVYDNLTRSLTQNSTKKAAISSYDKLLKFNGDGTIELYFGPKAPAGKETNWVDTSASKGWFAWFRFYAPTEAFFDKSWQLPDFELVK